MRPILWLFLIVIMGCSSESAPRAKTNGAAQNRVLSDELKAAMENAAEVRLYSIWGEDADETSSYGFHGYDNLGETELTDKTDIAKLTTALSNSIAGATSGPAACFAPRHGMRFVHDGHTYDFIICFECLQVSIYRDNVRFDSHILSIGDEAAPAAFNDALSKRDIALAPQRGGS